MCLVVLGLVAAFAPRYSALMQVVVCAAGGAAILFAWPQRASTGRTRTAGQRRLAIAWTTILIAGCL